MEFVLNIIFYITLNIIFKNIWFKQSRLQEKKNIL